MKRLLLLAGLFFCLNNLPAQTISKGKVTTATFLAPSLQGNHGGEDPSRRLTIYLPPGYDKSQDRYPVIYFLHGFLVNDQLLMEWDHWNLMMDSAIRSGHLRPMILVLPNSDNKFGGSFYTNSALTGNWADYIGKDVVNYVDKKYRTIPSRKSRGLSGHSMGGNGALKIAMSFPEVFGAVYALSPAVLGWAGDFTVRNPAFKGLDSFKNKLTAQEIMNGLSTGEPGGVKNFHAQVMAALARAYSPNDDHSILSADIPSRYVGDSLVLNDATEKKWQANFPLNMLENHLPAMKNLVALKIDWGRNEENQHIPETCLQFSKKLEANGIRHFAEEYIGGHVDQQGGWEGRLYTSLLPFFDRYLESAVKPGKK